LLPELRCQQLLGRLGQVVGASALPLLALRDGDLLNEGCAAIKNKDGLDAVEEKLGDPAQET
jgi:hypothetical protein